MGNGISRRIQKVLFPRRNLGIKPPIQRDKVKRSTPGTLPVVSPPTRPEITELSPHEKPLINPTSSPTDHSRELNFQEISERVEASGNPRLVSLWKSVGETKYDKDRGMPIKEIEKRKDLLLKITDNPKVNLLLSVAPVAFSAIYAVLCVTGLLSIPAVIALGIGSIGFTLIANIFAEGGMFYMSRYLKKLYLPSFLKRSNFKCWFENTDYTRQVSRKMKKNGIGDMWDNPDYEKVYTKTNGKNGEEVGAVDSEVSHIQFTMEKIHEILGRRNETGKHVQGKLTNSLKRGLKTAKRIVRDYGDLIDDLKSGSLSLDNCIFLFNEIKNVHIRPNSVGEREIDSAIDVLAKGIKSLKGAICVKVWDRDPYKDLSSSKEFNCCAFLGGIRDLGVFGYLLNKSITCLDFSSGDKRIARVIMGASYHMIEDKKVPILLIDSVEGTLSLDRRIILKAICDYAAACGFKKIIFNKKVTNVVSRKMIEFLAKQNFREGKVAIKLFDAISGEYLEAFERNVFRETFLRMLVWLPGNTKDYNYPKGKVTGYIVPVKFDAEIDGVRALKEYEKHLPEDVSLKVIKPSGWEKIKKKIMRIEREIFDRSLRQSEDDLGNTFCDPRSICIVAKKGKNIIGYIAGGPLEDYDYLDGVSDDPTIKKGNTAYIESHAVLGKHQGQGIGKALRLFFLQKAKERGYGYMSSHIKRKIALESGDKILSEHKDWGGSGVTFVYFSEKVS